MKLQKPKKRTTRITKRVVFFGQFLQFIATPLASRFVIKLFQSPMKHQLPEREQIMFKSAIKERLKIGGINKEIQVYKYGYSKKKVLLLHGWAGRGTQMFTIADKLLEHKRMVISIDGPSHGLSDGKRTNMPEFIESIKVIQEKYGPFEAAIGHSFGGMVLLKSVASFLSIEKLIVMGTADDVEEIIHDLTKKLQLKVTTANYVLRKLERQFKTPLKTLTSSVSAKAIKIPTLVIHDTDDKEVPVSCAYKIRQNLEYGKILITHKLGHQRILKDNAVQEHVIDFLTD